MRTKLIIFALALLAFAGCVPDVPEYVDGIILNLVVVDSETRDTKPGEEVLNENVLSNTIDIFFYDETTGVITKKLLGFRRNGNPIKIDTNPSDVERIFSGATAAGAHCGLFVVANFTGSYAGTDSIAQVKRSLVQAPAWETADTHNGNAFWNYVQSSFVMTGEMQLTLGNYQGSTPVFATVGMARVAAKVTFSVTVADNAIGDEANQWSPDKNNMEVYLVYAMRKATLGAEPQAMPVTANVTYGSGESVVYSQYNAMKLCATGDSISRNRVVNNDTTLVRVPVYTTIDSVLNVGQIKPFYTYPMQWETGSSMEPYLKLIIPWTYGNTTKKYYYKIPFHGNELLRNHWYHVSIDVQILGTEQADPPEVTISYAIAPWGGAIEEVTVENITSITSVPATVITARFLNVPTTEYVLYNVDSLVIPIQSSHDVEVVGFTVASGAYSSAHDIDANYIGINPRIYNPFSTTISNQIVAVRPNYSSATPTPASHSFTYNQPADGDGWSVVVNGRESITFTHAMKRNMSSSDYDVAPYTIRMRLRHEGEGASLYFTDVTIEQKPSIIIKPERNSDTGDTLAVTYDWRGNRTSDWGNGHTAEDGYVFNNGTRSNADQNSNRNNTNFNMYVIETSVLPTGGSLASYMLGDPRSRDPQTVSGTNDGIGIEDGNTRTLQNYYPAGTSTDYDNFIAPKFRIASSFGASPVLSRTNAILRCAAYQEDGYPAGRWRLPTVAEISYMARLTTDGLIPRLLGNMTNNNTTNYWSNSGYVAVANGTNTADPSPSTNYTNSTTCNVRCVYDEWYWEDTTREKADKTVFTWGDQLRSDVRKN